jgi:hypothetical protein
LSDELLRRLLRVTEDLSGVELNEDDLKDLKPSLLRIIEGVKAMDRLRMPGHLLPANLLVKSKEEE